MLAFPVDSAQHAVAETAQTRYMKRVLRDPNLATIFHFPTGNWIIARWVDHSRSAFIELGLLEPPFTLERFQQEVVSIQKMLTGEAADFLAQLAEESRFAEHRALSEEQDRTADELNRLEFLRRNSHLTHRDSPAWLLL